MAFFIVFSITLFCGTPSSEGDRSIQVSLYINAPIFKSLHVKKSEKQSDQLRHKMAFFIVFSITPILWNPSSEGDRSIQVSLYINAPIFKSLHVKKSEK